MIRNALYICLLFLSACGPSEKKESAMQNAAAQSVADTTSGPREILREGSLEIPVYSFPGFKPLLHQDDGKTYLINFWATWCAPCVKELPHFERIGRESSGQGVEVVLVSLDMPSIWESRLIPFVKEKGLKSRIVVLDDPKQNDWIPQVHGSWSGSIPATLIYNREKRLFYEEPFTYENLKEELTNFLNHE